MRVLFVDQFSDLGGAQLVLREVMSEAVRRGWEVWFAAPGNGDLFRFCETAGIRRQSLPTRMYRRGSKTVRDVFSYGGDMLRAARAIGLTVRQNQIDVVYANGPRILPAAAAAPCPLVFHLHSSLEKNYARAIVKMALKKKRSAVIAASQFVVSELQKDHSARVIYNGVADCGYVPSPRPRNTATIRAVVGIVGRISHEKGHLDLVRAASLLTARGHDIRFAIIGAALSSNPGYDASVREAAAGLPVQFRGWTDDVASALHELDILAVPSLGNECSPRIVLEAFSAGTPVVAYRCGGIPELVRHGDTGILTEKSDPEALAAAIEALLADRAQMARLAENGRREWSARFGLERFLIEVAEVIECACPLRFAPPAQTAVHDRAPGANVVQRSPQQE